MKELAMGMMPSTNEFAYLGHLDDEFKDLRGNEHRLEQWVSQFRPPAWFLECSP